VIPIRKPAKAKARPKPELPKGIDSTYELAYLKSLETQKQAGTIRAYYVKPGSLRLGTGCHYEPDFMVVTEDGTLEYHEVKGPTRFAAKSLTKLKAAAHIYQDIVFKLCMGKSLISQSTGKKLLAFEPVEVI
jgi:hypothetical protein